MLWEPEPSTLGGGAVDGPPSTWYKFALGGNPLPTVTHSRYYEPTNDYITLKAPGLPANASEWVWVSSDNSSLLGSGSGHAAAVSTSSGFFKHIYQRAKAGLGMVTCECSNGRLVPTVAATLTADRCCEQTSRTSSRTRMRVSRTCKGRSAWPKRG